MTSFIPTFHQSYMLIISQYKFLDLTLYQNPVLYHNLSPEYIPTDVPKSSGTQHDTIEIHGLHSTFPLLPSSQILCIPNSSAQSTASLSLIFQRSRCHPGQSSANTCKAAVNQTSPCLHGDLPPSLSPPLNGGLILSPHPHPRAFTLSLVSTTYRAKLHPVAWHPRPFVTWPQLPSQLHLRRVTFLQNPHSPSSGPSYAFLATQFQYHLLCKAFFWSPFSIPL